jgi:SAM-dependent methyltransferase
LAACRSYCGLDYPVTALDMYGTRPDVFGDGCRLPFSDESFDSVLMLDVLEHISRPEAALAEARRVMRPGGKLLLTIPFAYPLHDEPHDYQRLTEHGLAYRVRQAGLHLTKIHQVGTAAEAASGNLAMALAQGAIDAISSRSWRMLWLPALPPLVLLANLVGWMSAGMLPTRRMMPGAYYVEARRT